MAEMDRASRMQACTRCLAPQAKRIAVGMGCINLLLPAVLLVHARVSGETYASLFHGPQSALTLSWRCR